MEMWIIWLIIAGFFFILEIATVGFLVFWFGIAALIAMGLSFLGCSIPIQVAVFVISSAILILFTRKFAKKVQPKDVATNVYTILGKKAVVIQKVDNIKSNGQIKVDGDIWSARSENDEVISQGSNVEILRIDGVKAVVKEIK